MKLFFAAILMAVICATAVHGSVVGDFLLNWHIIKRPPIRFDSPSTIETPTTLKNVLDNLEKKIFKPVLDCVLGGVYDAKQKLGNENETFDSVRNYFIGASAEIIAQALALKTHISTEENFDKKINKIIKNLNKKLTTSLGQLKTNRPNEYNAFLRSINSCFETEMTKEMINRDD